MSDVDPSIPSHATGTSMDHPSSGEHPPARGFRRWWSRCRCWWQSRVLAGTIRGANSGCLLCGHASARLAVPEAGDQRRAETVKAWAARGIVGTVLALSLVTISSVLTVAFHALLPARYHYLDPEQLEAIRTFLAVMLVSSVLSDYARRLLDR